MSDDSGTLGEDVERVLVAGRLTWRPAYALKGNWRKGEPTEVRYVWGKVAAGTETETVAGERVRRWERERAFKSHSGNYAQERDVELESPRTGPEKERPEVPGERWAWRRAKIRELVQEKNPRVKRWANDDGCSY